MLPVVDRRPSAAVVAAVTDLDPTKVLSGGTVGTSSGGSLGRAKGSSLRRASTLGGRAPAGGVADRGGRVVHFVSCSSGARVRYRPEPGFADEVGASGGAAIGVVQELQARTLFKGSHARPFASACLAAQVAPGVRRSRNARSVAERDRRGRDARVVSVTNVRMETRGRRSEEARRRAPVRPAGAGRNRAVGGAL
jgi:hypothetical protein